MSWPAAADGWAEADRSAPGPEPRSAGKEACGGGSGRAWASAGTDAARRGSAQQKAVPFKEARPQEGGRKELARSVMTKMLFRMGRS